MHRRVTVDGMRPGAIRSLVSWLLSPRQGIDAGGGHAISTTEIRTLAEQFLKSYPGHAFCDDCLADRVGLELREVRYAKIALAGSAEFEQRTWFCSVCLEWRQVIHVAWLWFTSTDSDPTY